MTLLTTAFAQGTHAARPAAAAGNNGFYYYETDTGNLFQSTGAAWQQVASSFASPLTTKGDVFGYSSANARVPVGADGTVLTADSSQALGVRWAAGGGGGVGANLFTSVLGADTATIDSGAGGFSTAYNFLLILLYLRTDEAVVLSTCSLNVNNDAGANYDRQALTGVSATPTAGQQLGATAWQTFAAGANATASVYMAARLTIPAYAGTTGFKAAEYTGGKNDATAGNNRLDTNILTWHSTAAITRVAITAPGAQKLKAGSAMYVYGF